MRAMLFLALLSRPFGLFGSSLTQEVLITSADACVFVKKKI